VNVGLPYDAVVVGAGPAGSATAARLAASGLTVALLDRARFPRPKPCAEYVSPGAVAALERLGVLPAILAERPQRLRGMRILAPGAEFTGTFLAGAGLALPRERLDQRLAEFALARGARWFEATSFEGFTRERDGTLRIRARQAGRPLALNTRLLVGADGLNSRVARQLGVARRRGPRRAALVAHATGIVGLADVGEMHVGAAGYAGLAPLGGGLANVALVVDLARGQIRPPLDQALHRHLAALPTLRDRLEELELVSPVRAVGPFGHATTRAGADSVLLVGDAADFYDPFTGEGIYAALRGGELAAQCAVRALDGVEPSATALARYERLRRQAFRSKWVLERIVSWVVARPGAMAHVGRRLGRRADLADQLVSVTAHVTPASRVFRPGFILGLVA